MNDMETLVTVYQFSIPDIKAFSVRERMNWLSRAVERIDRRRLAHEEAMNSVR